MTASLMRRICARLWEYCLLTRLHKPIGTLLLLWPTLWALWLASGGFPSARLLLTFCLGTLLMRSAGCAVNDYADRDFDPHVERTRQRPLAAKRIRGREALLVAGVLSLLAYLLILDLNALTRELSVVALALAASYPFTKRFFVLPQAYLGVAFGFGIPMAYAAVLGRVPAEGWVLLLANIAWTIAYDTEYAMVDREDDRRIGIRTSALFFGRRDLLAVALFHLLALTILGLLGLQAGLRWPYYLGLAGAAGLAARQVWRIRGRARAACFEAFNNNNWLGAAVFLGLALALA